MFPRPRTDDLTRQYFSGIDAQTWLTANALPLLYTTMPSSAPVFATPLTKIFKINHPVMLAGEPPRPLTFS
jgi:hypothetical protein